MKPGIRAKRMLLSLLTIAMLVSCGGGGGGSTPATTPPTDTGINGGTTPLAFVIQSGGAACGTAALGCSADIGGGDGAGGGDGSGGAGGSESAMRNVTVTAYRPDGTVLGSAPLTNNLVSVFPNSYTGPFILRFVPQTNGEYFDEAKRAWVSLGNTTLRVMVPSLTHHVSVNSLTEAAYQMAIKAPGGEAALTAASMTQFNNVVRDQFNAKVVAAYRTNDVTNFATSLDDLSGFGTLPNTFAGRYAAMLAALPIAGSTFSDGVLAAPALSYTGQIANDLVADSLLDDTGGAGYANSTYNAATLTPQLTSGVCTAISVWGSASLPSPLAVTAAASAAAAGQLSVTAGDIGLSGACDGVGAAARFASPQSVAVGTGGIYVTDTGNHTIRQVSAAGAVGTFAGSRTGASGTADTPVPIESSFDRKGSAARFNTPAGIAVDSAGIVYVADQSSHTIRRIATDGVVTTLAGAAGQSGYINNTGRSARFNSPSRISLTPTGDLMVADTGNNTMRLVTPAGVVSDVPNWPGGLPGAVTFDTLGNAFVAKTSEHKIVKVTLATGSFVTLAGSNLNNPGYADGNQTAALFNTPTGITIDGSGNLYVADSGNRMVRRVTAAGVVTTTVGSVSVSGIQLGVLPARLGAIRNVAMSGQQLLVLSDNALLVTIP